MAIGGVRVFCIVVLMVLFRRVEGYQRLNNGDDRLVKQVFSFQLIAYHLGDVSLVVVVGKDDRTILFADIVSLLVERGWVMGSKKDFDKLLIGNNLWIKAYLKNFGVAGLPTADFLVGGMWFLTSGISDNNFLDADELLKKSLPTPEAARTECCELVCR